MEKWVRECQTSTLRMEAEIKEVLFEGQSDFQKVVFMDSATGAKFLAGSTLKPEETIDYEGETYPLVRVEVSSDSHPFYTGKQKFAQADGRIEKFNKKYGLKN